MTKKLTRPEVLAIRRQYDLGHAVKQLAEAYGVSTYTISMIGNRRSHKRVLEGDAPPLPTAPRAPRPPTTPQRKAKKIDNFSQQVNLNKK